jgi:hypothetical protein
MSLVNQSIIKHKMGLLNLAEQLQNVSQACRVMVVSRTRFTGSRSEGNGRHGSRPPRVAWVAGHLLPTSAT